MRFPPGHYYSPVPDDRELLAAPRRSQVWPATTPDTPGIEWRADAQRRLCVDVFARQPRVPWPSGPEPGDSSAYHYENVMFPPLDAWLLESMLRWLKPRRMIEVGSGFSSLVAARVNQEALDGALDLSCIDPHPPAFLGAEIPGIAEVLVRAVQDVPLDTFAELGRDDILFIDTSHTVKTGGDVPWIYNQILPRLAPGVVVHLHDVFLPRDYPEPWVRDGFGWNEQYLIQSFLAFNRAFAVLVGASYLLEHGGDALIGAFPELPTYAHRGGSSLWLSRVD